MDAHPSTCVLTMDGPMTAAPFRIDVEQPILDDLWSRLRRVRLPRGLVGDDWRYGVNAGYLAELIEYWLTAFDWRAQERRLNRLTHFRATVDRVPIHFIHERGQGPDPLPLVLTHGWPWTFWDFKDMIAPLADPGSFGADPADAFDVVVPSLPGFGFSTPLQEPVTIWRVADIWMRLMHDVLGYSRFAAHGGDFGALATAQLGHKYADRVVGVHIAPRPVRLDAWNVVRPWADLVAGTLPGEAGPQSAMVEWESKKVGHLVAHVLGPQTLSVGLHDSPAGLAAWLVERRRNWSDCGGDVESVFSKDELLTNVMLYWVTESFVTSARLYHDNWRVGWRPAHDRQPVVEAPTGVALFTQDLPPNTSTRWIAEYFNLQRLTKVDRGGHFAAAERPEAIVEELRAFFRPLRRN
jgi:pimeloyl-ACP methyl ester carboxylesterase